MCIRDSPVDVGDDEAHPPGARPELVEGEDHHAVNPPSTTSVAPVTYDDASLARNTRAPW